MHRWQGAVLAAAGFVAGIVAGQWVWEAIAWREIRDGMRGWR
jgi:hypothetical protein